MWHIISSSYLLYYLVVIDMKQTGKFLAYLWLHQGVSTQPAIKVQYLIIQVYRDFITAINTAGIFCGKATMALR